VQKIGDPDFSLPLLLRQDIMTFRLAQANQFGYGAMAMNPHFREQRIPAFI